MTDGFLNDLPELDMPGRKRKKKSPKPKSVDAVPDDADQVVRYIRPRCPKCGSTNVPVYDSSHLPIRYHKCAKCGFCFKSVEIE